MNTERDTYNQIEYAREEGIDIETISELTGLTAEEVSRLKKELNNA